MDILNDLKRKIKGTRGRLIERDIYQSVMEEIKSKKRHDGIWGQALAETEGNEKKANALYIKLRVQSVKDELEVFKENIFREQQTKNNSKQKTSSIKKRNNVNKEDNDGGGFGLFIFYGTIITIITYAFVIFVNWVNK